MGRPPRPWYSTERDGWYVYRGGKRYLLARGRRSKAAALQAFYVLMAATPVELQVKLVDPEGEGGEKGKMREH